MSTTQRKLIVILGPTASGKTGLGIELAKTYHGEIISADSRQIYKGMNIGTAKPTLGENSTIIQYKTTDSRLFDIPVFNVEGIPHYLFDVVYPDETFTVSHFKQLSEHCIESIYAHDHIPLIVGGTGFYISSVVDNLSIPEVEPDWQFRRNLEAQLEKGTVTVHDLYTTLLNKDPHSAEFVEPHNPRRIIRALEIIHVTGKPVSTQRGKGEQRYDVLQIGLKHSEKTLQHRINARVDEMMETGLLDEVTRLYRQFCHHATLHCHSGLDPESKIIRKSLDPHTHEDDKAEYPPALSGIGYREIIDYLNKKTTLEKAVDLIKLHTFQFAKRQIKWFKRDKRIIWIDNNHRAVELARKHIRAT